MNFEKKLRHMLNHVGYDLAEQPIQFVSPADIWTADMRFFEPIVERLFANDFTFSEIREAEIFRTITELLTNARRACEESPRKFVTLDSYIGDGGLVAYVKDEGSGFDADKVIAERREQLHLYDGARVVSKCHGRGEGVDGGGVGMYSLLTFANDFQYSSKGNEVAVRFDLDK